MSTEISPAMSRRPPSLTVDRFFDAVQSGNPFAINRVSDPSQMEGDVTSIHRQQFDRLTGLAEESLQTHRGLGALLLGGAGTGKSHLLARVSRWAGKSDHACFVFLHNIQAAPEDMNRYLLKCCISKLAEDRLERLQDTMLFRVVDAAIRKTAVEEKIVKLNDDNRKDVYQRLAARLGGDMQVFDVIFNFFCSVNFAQTAKDADARKHHGETASLAVRWLKGDLLDVAEAKKLGQRVRPQDEVVQLAEHQVEAVWLILTRLAALVRRPFVLCVDQADTMKPEQLTALGRTVHPLIDHAENLLVVVSGVREDLLNAIADNTIPAAVADRLDHQHPIVINRIKRAEARQILEERLHRFLAPFESLAEVSQRFKQDALFPLGAAWLAQCEPNALEVRPRDVLSWANDRWNAIKDRIAQQGGNAWIEGWDAPPQPVGLPKLTAEQILEAIDRKVSDKVAEAINGRRLQPGSLPADAGNLLGLTKILLEQCLGRPERYTLESVAARGKQQADLVIDEIRPGDGRPVRNHVQFVVTGSKTSAAFQLRKLLDGKDADMRVLVTDQERFPLQVGPRGQEYLSALEKLGNAFVHLPLTFEQYAQLDALEAVIGQAHSGDLEIELRRGVMMPVDETQVIESHHRRQRYEKHVLLGMFLTEEPAVPPAANGPATAAIAAGTAAAAFPPKNEFREFVLAQLALEMGSRLGELLDRFIAKQHGARPREACYEAAKTIILEMHDEELLCAKPWDDDFFLTVGTKA